MEIPPGEDAAAATLSEDWQAAARKVGFLPVSQRSLTLLQPQGAQGHSQNENSSLFLGVFVSFSS